MLLGIKADSTFMGMSAETAKIVTIVLIGVLMIVYVTIGGMKGTTYVQIVKAFMLMLGALLLTLMVGVAYKFNLSELLGEAALAIPASLPLSPPPALGPRRPGASACLICRPSRPSRGSPS